MNILTKIVFVLLFLAVLVGSIYWDYTRDKTSDDKQAFEHRDQVVAQLDAEQHRLGPRIQKLAGSGKCHETSDCRVVGLGIQTCGQFHNFLFYSIKDADESSLKAVIQQFNSNQTQLSNLSLAVPNCGKPAPEVICASEQCTAVEK